MIPKRGMASHPIHPGATPGVQDLIVRKRVKAFWKWPINTGSSCSSKIIIHKKSKQYTNAGTTKSQTETMVCKIHL